MYRLFYLYFYLREEYVFKCLEKLLVRIFVKFVF